MDMDEHQQINGAHYSNSDIIQKLLQTHHICKWKMNKKCWENRVWSEYLNGKIVLKPRSKLIKREFDKLEFSKIISVSVIFLTKWSIKRV